MSEHTQDSSQQRYNDIAIATAEKLNLIRKTVRHERTTSPPSLEVLFPDHNRVPVGIAQEYERMDNRPVSEHLAALADLEGAELEHLGLTLGTVVHGIDLTAAFTEARIAFLRSVLLERKVIFFRDQHLTEDQQVEFARQFGDLDAFPFGKPGANPFILEIIHDELSPGNENGWHTDVTWMESPSLGSIAQCTECPPFGGDTLFSDSHAAFLGLPENIKNQISTLSGVNDYRVFLNRGGVQVPESLANEMMAQIPFGVAHPLARQHPETGKLALYIHGGFLRHDSLFDHTTGEALGSEASKALVAELLKQHGRPEYQCRFQWSKGDIAFWDNRAVQHYAASDYYPHQRRLRRVTVSGSRPY